jgi:ABC-type polysaccharide/polyol phosphate transport system ATPase subunit
MKHLKININKYEIDSEIILQDIDFTLNKNDKIAIV